MAAGSFSKKFTGKRSTKIPEVVKEYVKKKIEEDNRTIIVDTFNSGGVVPPITCVQTSSFNLSALRPLQATGDLLKSDRMSNDVKIINYWHRFHVNLPGGASNVLRLVLVRYPRNDRSDMNGDYVIQHNGLNQATTSPLQDNCPYQILMDKSYVMNNADGIGATTKIITIKKNWKKAPKRVEYVDASLTGGVADTSSGLLRLFYFQYSNAVGTGMTIVNNCYRIEAVDSGNPRAGTS